MSIRKSVRGGSKDSGFLFEAARMGAISVRDYGADPNNNDPAGTRAAIQDATDDVTGTEKVLVIPEGEYAVDQLLDFKDIKYIDCRGIIKSTVTSGPAVEIGTEGNAGTAIEYGNIKLHVAKRDATVNASSIGIRCYGCSHAHLWLGSKFFETGLEIAPDGNVGTQYFSKNNVRFRNFGDSVAGTIALHFNGVNGGWINENTWSDLTVGKAETGIKISGSLRPDNNVFIKSNLEDTTTPIDMDEGGGNLWLYPRLENSGSIRFGRNTYLNHVWAGYNQSEIVPDVVHESCFPNFVSGSHGIQWQHIVSILPSEWTQYDTSQGSDRRWQTSKLISENYGGHRFEYAEATDTTFTIGSNDKGNLYIPVETGDVFLLDWGPVEADITISALDASKTLLPILSPDFATFQSDEEIPYLGTSKTSIEFGTTARGRLNDLDENPGGYLVSVNRSEVKFLNIQLRNDAFEYFHLKGYSYSDGARDWENLGNRTPDTKYIDDETTEDPDRPFQIAIKRSDNTVWFATNHNTWVQVG